MGVHIFFFGGGGPYWNYTYIYNQSQSQPLLNFLSTVVFNFDHVYSSGIFCHFLRTSLTKELLVGHKKGVFDRFCGQTNDSFVALTQCDEQIPIKWQ